jgi:hypothetical protein
MKQRITNQLNMAGTTIGIAISKDYKDVWFGQAPADFGTDMDKLQTDYKSTTDKAALADGASGGGGDAKAGAETALEDTSYVLTRALANHFKKTGDLLRLGKSDLAKRDIVRLTGQELVAKTTEIRDLGNGAVAETGAAGRGVTAERIAAVTSAITGYQAVMNTPRGQIVNHSTLLKEVETDAADLMVQLSDLDDLNLQFNGTDAGRRFIEAWKRARNIVDAGHGPAAAKPAPAPAAPPPKV